MSICGARRSSCPLCLTQAEYDRGNSDISLFKLCFVTGVESRQWGGSDNFMLCGISFPFQTNLKCKAQRKFAAAYWAIPSVKRTEVSMGSNKRKPVSVLHPLSLLWMCSESTRNAIGYRALPPASIRSWLTLEQRELTLKQDTRQWLSSFANHVGFQKEFFENHLQSLIICAGYWFLSSSADSSIWVRWSLRHRETHDRAKPTNQAWLVLSLSPPVLSTWLPTKIAALHIGCAHCSFEGHVLAKNLPASSDIRPNTFNRVAIKIANCGKRFVRDRSLTQCHTGLLVIRSPGLHER